MLFPVSFVILQVVCLLLFDLTNAEEIDSKITVLPETGYFVGLTNDQGTVFKTVSSNKGYIDCAVVRIMNSGNIKEIFTRTDQLVNSRHVWASEDGYYLFYLTPSGDGDGRFGTWLIGQEPGMDSGFAYWKPSFSTLTPIHREAKWYWTVDKVWTQKADTSVECVEGGTEGQFFSASAIINGGGSEISTTVIQRIAMEDSKLSYSYFESVKNAWVQLDSVTNIIAKGFPFSLVTEEIVDVSGSIQAEGSTAARKKESCNAVVVNDEYLYEYYRLMIRCLDTNTEHFLNFGERGLFVEGETISAQALSGTEKAQAFKSMSTDFETVATGDFVWIWYKKYSSDASNVEDLLVKCIGSVGNRRVFQYYLTDRRAALSRSILSQSTDLLIVRVLESGDLHLDWQGALDDIDSTLTAAFFIGHDLISWISDYILGHEGRFGDLSSCFLYHAAIAMPASLIYATELICLLMGAKPVTMVQFTTATDHQIKLPYVSEISNTLIAAIESGGTTDFGYRIHKYFSDETIIFYRKSREYLVDMLLPRGEAQALHIAPYESKDDPSLNEQEYREQIYNSYWNGNLLGYPARFVESYCRDFHNEHIDIKLKEEEIRRAKNDLRALYSSKTMKAPVDIRLGLDSDKLSEIRKLDVI